MESLTRAKMRNPHHRVSCITYLFNRFYYLIRHVPFLFQFLQLKNEKRTSLNHTYNAIGKRIYNTGRLRIVSQSNTEIEIDEL